jgi:16S rRNA (guanine527-N7)-methyltransferase
MPAEEVSAGRAAAGLLGAGEVEVHQNAIASLGQHRFVVIPKARVTPAAYPRRPGEPARRPLG